MIETLHDLVYAIQPQLMEYSEDFEKVDNIQIRTYVNACIPFCEKPRRPRSIMMCGGPGPRSRFDRSPRFIRAPLKGFGLWV